MITGGGVGSPDGQGVGEGVGGNVAVGLHEISIVSPFLHI